MMKQVEERLSRSSKEQVPQQVVPAQEEAQEAIPTHTTALGIASTEHILRTVISNAPIVLFAVDANGIFTLSEGQGLQTLGLKGGEVVGASIFEVYRDIPEIITYICRALDGESFTANGYVGDKVFETCYMPQYNASGEVSGVIGVATDVSMRVKAEEALKTSERKFRALTEQSTDLIFILSATGVFQYASPSHQHMLAYTRDELLGRNVFEFIHPADKKQVHISWEAAFQGSGSLAHTVCRLRHANGTWLTLEAIGRNCFDDPDIQGFIVNAHDVTERINMEQELRHSALHDSLTGLPNRTSLLAQLEEAIQATTPQVLALMMLNLNRFKDINETFGYTRGDVLLLEISQRLRKALPDSCAIARPGGDEFAIVLPGAGEEEMRQAAVMLHAALEQPFFIEEHPLQVDASMGGVIFPAHGSDPLDLLRKADVAMYRAKQTHQQFALYEDGHEQSTARRLDLIGALRQTISTGGFMLYYQPKVEMKTGIVHGVEALLRWQHPTFGFIPPDQFIPLAEQTGLIAPLTRWVLEAALRQCKDWLAAGIDLEVAVNFSMWDLRDPSLPATIGQMLTHYGIASRYLRVELTESAAMADPDHTLAVLQQLAAVGIRSSIDDFGTGYSSLAYLKRLLVNELKIDRTFVRHITEEGADQTIVRSTVEMAHSLGLKVVVEGVEDAASFQLLSELGCDTAQGYYLSRPLPPQELERWLAQRRNRLPGRLQGYVPTLHA